MNKKKILLIEDNKLPQLIVKGHLEKLNCSVDVADTGEAGIQYCIKNKYHLILMDVGLPGIDVISAAQIIRQQKNPNKQTPIVALTAHDDETIKSKAFAVGINDYLIKPLTLESAETILKKYCAEDDSNASAPSYNLKW